MTYRKIVSSRLILVVTAITILLLLCIIYFHPLNIAWVKKSFSWGNLLQFVFVDQFIIELISSCIIARGIGVYGTYLKLRKTPKTPEKIFKYFLKFLPFILGIYFVFAPLTTGVRFLYHNFILQRLDLDYFSDYFPLNLEIYLAYLPLVFLTTVQFLGFLIHYSIKLKEMEGRRPFKKILLSVKTLQGATKVDAERVVAVVRQQQRYWVKTTDTQFWTHKNLSELEKHLDINFIRANRSTLINLVFLKNYSFWKNERYILRMQNGDEYNITRDRLKQIKSRINKCLENIKDFEFQ